MSRNRLIRYVSDQWSGGCGRQVASPAPAAQAKAALAGRGAALQAVFDALRAECQARAANPVRTRRPRSTTAYTCTRLFNVSHCNISTTD